MDADFGVGADSRFTLERAKLWDVQTPQIMRPQLLRDGFANANAKGLAVTDDVSVVNYGAFARPAAACVARESKTRAPTRVRDDVVADSAVPAGPFP